MGAALDRSECAIPLSRLFTPSPELELAADAARIAWKPGTSEALATLPVRPGEEA